MSRSSKGVGDDHLLMGKIEEAQTDLAFWKRDESQSEDTRELVQASEWRIALEMKASASVHRRFEGV